MERNNQEAVHLEIRMLLDAVGRAAKRDLDRRLTEAQTPITGLQYIVLRILIGQPYSSSELGRELNHEPNTIVQVVDSLVRAGLVERGQDARDRRRSPLLVTEDGKRLLERIPIIDQGDALASSLRQLGEAREQRLLEDMRSLATLLLASPEAVQALSDTAARLVNSIPPPKNTSS